LEWRFESVEEIYPSSTLADIMALLRAQGTPDSDFDSAELICVELFSNLIRHARGAVRIELDWGGDFPKLSIIDVEKRSNAPPIRLPADLLAESGRGLFIIKALAKDLQLSTSGGGVGSRTCATLPVRRAQGSALRPF
jgi:anti-sigma regulatory factor (Ser/Thr protein kinase)